VAGIDQGEGTSCVLSEKKLGSLVPKYRAIKKTKANGELERKGRAKREKPLKRPTS